MSTLAELSFCAIDIELANPDPATICQVGLVEVRAGRIVDRWSSLVNPQAEFDGFNMVIHGLGPADVVDSPKFPVIYEQLRCRFGAVVLSHTPFDRAALRAASERYGCEPLEITWLDSARVVRRVWPRYARRGWGLENLARNFSIAYQAHNALEDARVAAELVIRAWSSAGLTEMLQLIRMGTIPPPRTRRRSGVRLPVPKRCRVGSPRYSAHIGHAVRARSRVIRPANSTTYLNFVSHVSVFIHISLNL